MKERFQSEKEPVDITAVRVAQIRGMKLPLKTRDREKLTKKSEIFGVGFGVGFFFFGTVILKNWAERSWVVGPFALGKR